MVVGPDGSEGQMSQASKKQANLARFLYTLSGLTYAGMGFLFSYLFIPLWQEEGFSPGSLLGWNVIPVLILGVAFLILMVLAYIIDPKEDS